MNTQLAIATLVLFLLPNAFAEHIRHMSFNAPEETLFSLDVANTAGAKAAVLIQFYNHKAQEMQNQVFEIDPSESKSIKLDSLTRVTRGIRIQTTESLKLKALSTYRKSTSAYPLAEHASNSLILTELHSDHKKLHLYNPTHEATRVELSLGASHLQEVYLEGQESLSVNLNAYNINTTELRIASNVKLVASVARVDQEGRLQVQVAKAHSPLSFGDIDENRAYFLMSTGAPMEPSYVVALEKTEMILEARAQIKNPMAAKILIGKVATGHGNFNREFGHPSNSFWSWHISEALEFTDFGAQKCDGDPQLIEDVLPYWMQAVGTICFWNYRIARELSPEEVRTGLLK